MGEIFSLIVYVRPIASEEKKDVALYMWAGQVCSAESKAESWQVVVGKLLLWELSVFLRTGQGSERASTCSCNTSQLVGKLLRGCRHGISYEGKVSFFLPRIPLLPHIFHAAVYPE